MLYRLKCRIDVERSFCGANVSDNIYVKKAYPVPEWRRANRAKKEHNNEHTNNVAGDYMYEYIFSELSLFLNIVVVAVEWLCCCGKVNSCGLDSYLMLTRVRTFRAGSHRTCAEVCVCERVRLFFQMAQNNMYSLSCDSINSPIKRYTNALNMPHRIWMHSDDDVFNIRRSIGTPSSFLLSCFSLLTFHIGFLDIYV